MINEERTKLILSILRKKKVIKTSVLQAKLYCSNATLRRDLIELEKSGIIIRQHGSVRLTSSHNTEFSYKFRDTEQLLEKEYLASLVDIFLTDGQAVFFDSSSTVEKVCPYLEKFNNMIVVTNGLNTAQNLATYDNLRVYVAGGELKNRSSSLLGEFSNAFITNFKADVAIISCRGLDKDGIYEANLNQALFKQKMISNAKFVILLCDNSKFDTSYYFRLIPYNQIDVIITDKEPQQKYKELLESNNCELIF